MKPRQRPVPLTRQDVDIWRRVLRAVPQTEYGNSWALCMVHDRRDADLMFRRMDAQRVGFLNGYDWRTERHSWFPSRWGSA